MKEGDRFKIIGSAGGCYNRNCKDCFVRQTLIFQKKVTGMEIPREFQGDGEVIYFQCEDDNDYYCYCLLKDTDLIQRPWKDIIEGK